MRVLIDESLPVELADELPGIDATTVHAQRWLRLRNGVLLRAAVDAGFTVILTGDQSLQYQQNLRKIGIAAVIVSGIRNRIEELRPLIPEIIAALNNVRSGEALEVTG